MSTFKAQESKNLAQLANIRGKIHGLIGLNLVQPTRRFIYEGDVDKVSASSGIINTRHLFLFNDLLVYGSVKHKGTLYEYSDHIFVKHLSLKDISFKSSSKHGFQLVRSDDTKQRDYIMLCRSVEDKQSWMQHIKFVIEEQKNPETNHDKHSSESLLATPASKPTRIKKSTRESSEGLMKAALVGNVDVISQHLREGFDISTHDSESGQTMLHKISHAGHATLLHILLESYAGNKATLVNVKDFHGATALHYAANTGHVDCLKILQSYGANPEMVDDDQATPLHYAARSGHCESLLALLDHKTAGLVFKKDSQGLTPAAYAAFHGHKDALTALLLHMRTTINLTKTSQPQQSESPPTQRKDTRSNTSAHDPQTSIIEPLHLAAMNGHTECVKAVMDCLASMEANELARGEGESGGEQGKQGVLRVNANTKDRQGLTAAHHAALNGHLAPLSLLQKRGADMQAKDSTGGTVLHAACTGGSIECLKFLMNKNYDITFKDSGGMSPLHRATVAGHLCIVWEIINSSACTEELINMKDTRGQTALHIASENKWGGCALLLMNSGKCNLTIRDEDACTPLHVAMKNGAKEIVSYIANTEHELTQKEGEALLRIGKQHVDCVKIITKITGLNADTSSSHPTAERSSSISSFSSDAFSEGSNVDSASEYDSEDEEDSDDDEEFGAIRSEIKQRILEIWRGVRSNELLVNLLLETVRNLYRLPQDGDFGVTYWTYVNNFVQKVAQNPATDRGLLALRQDLNLDFLENHTHMVRTGSMLDVRAYEKGNTDEPEKTTDKPLLHRTVATRRIPLGTSLSTITRPPLMARSPASLSSISIPPPAIRASSPGRSASSAPPSPSSSPPTLSFMSSAASSPSIASRRASLLSPSVSLSSFSSLLTSSMNASSSPPTSGDNKTKIAKVSEVKALEELDVSQLKPKVVTLDTSSKSFDNLSKKQTQKSNLDVERPKEATRLSHKKSSSTVSADLVAKIELDKEALLRMLHKKVQISNVEGGEHVENALESALRNKDTARLSAERKSNSEPKLLRADGTIPEPSASSSKNKSSKKTPPKEEKRKKELDVSPPDARNAPRPSSKKSQAAPEKRVGTPQGAKVNSSSSLDNRAHSPSLQDNRAHSPSLRDNRAHSPSLRDNLAHSPSLRDNQPHSSSSRDNQPHSPATKSASKAPPPAKSVSVSEKSVSVANPSFWETALQPQLQTQSPPQPQSTQSQPQSIQSPPYDSDANTDTAWDETWRSKRKSDPSFWENALKLPDAAKSGQQPPPKSVSSGKRGVDVAVDAEVNSLEVNVGVGVGAGTNPWTLQYGADHDVDARKMSEVSTAIEAIRNMQPDELKVDHVESDNPLPRPSLGRTASTWRATKRVVFLDKKREEQIASVLNGHGVSPKQLKQAILNADCSILIPGLLSALVPILPSKKEAALSVDHHFPDMETLTDLSDRELAQFFVVEMASVSRVNQRVEALVVRSDFELKASVIHQMMKSHFSICSKLTTNNKLKDIIEILLAYAVKVPLDSTREDIIFILRQAIVELHEKIPEFIFTISDISSSNPTKDMPDISVAWTELQYGLSVCKQEIQKCSPTDQLLLLLKDFVAEAEPELESLQNEVDVWETITEKIGVNLGELAAFLCKDGSKRDGVGGDLISILCSVFALILKIIKEEEDEQAQKVSQRELDAEFQSNRTQKSKKPRKHKRPENSSGAIGPKSPFGRENLKGERILQPELTPLRVTYNAYKDFCAKTSKVKRKTYTFLKNQSKQRIKEDS